MVALKNVHKISQTMYICVCVCLLLISMLLHKMKGMMTKSFNNSTFLCFFDVKIKRKSKHLQILCMLASILYRRLEN